MVPSGAVKTVPCGVGIQLNSRSILESLVSEVSRVFDYRDLNFTSGVNQGQ